MSYQLSEYVLSFQIHREMTEFNVWYVENQCRIIASSSRRLPAAIIAQTNRRRLQGKSKLIILVLAIHK